MNKYWIGKSECVKVIVFFAGDIGFLIDESESTEHINPKNWTDCWAQSNFTNITTSYLRNTKIRAKSKRHCLMIQRLVINNGGQWPGIGAVLIDDEFKYIRIDSDMDILTTEKEAAFDFWSAKEIHLPMPPGPEVSPESQLPEVVTNYGVPTNCPVVKASLQEESPTENPSLIPGDDVVKERTREDLAKRFTSIYVGSGDSAPEVKEPTQKVITDNDRLRSVVKDAIKETAGDVLREMVDRESHAAISTLENLGYTYHGGELWKPPLGECPEHICEEWPQVGDEVAVSLGVGVVKGLGVINGQKCVFVQLENTCETTTAFSRPPTSQEKLADTLTKITGYHDRQAVMRAAKAILEGAVHELEYKGGDE